MKKYEQWFPSEPKFISTVEYHDAIIENLEMILARYDEINFDINSSDLSDIEQLEPGTYRLKVRPTAELLSKLPYYKNCNSEIGVFCIDNQWLIIIGEEGVHKVTLPPELAVISHDCYFQIDMHSHPFIKFDDSYAQPTLQDLSLSDSTIDKCLYIISHRGLIEIQNTLFSTMELKKISKLWEEWINNLELGNFTGWELAKMFCEKFFNEKIYSWDDKKLIDGILSDKEKTTREILKNK